MKIIIDANCGYKVRSDDGDGSIILRKLLQGKLTLCLSSALKSELSKTPLSEIYKDLALAGLILEVTDEVLGDGPGVLKKCTSNDCHIIHLAISSGCRLLFSNDKPLHSDFTNGEILNSPRGKIYQDITHAHLLPT